MTDPMMPDQVVLAVDTSGLVCAGVAHAGQVVASEVVADSRAHVEQLTPTVAAALSAAGVGLADVDAVVVGLGPGPFTGLRVGIVTGWTLAAVSGIEVHGICSLDVLAAQWVGPDATGGTGSGSGEFVVCADARRKELYWARYVGTERVGGPYVTEPAALPDLPIIGPGTSLYGDVLGDRVAAGGPTQLDPGVMAAVGLQLPSAGTEPLYLRRPDAAVSTNRKSALPTGPRVLPGLTPRGRS
ncbi:tRNA (adenosine(37)-N6)-threonylcarbamoyltransferase complex dimerization subunit type 1 TsaB [Propionibacteriaceae bacterium Y2011]